METNELGQNDKDITKYQERANELEKAEQILSKLAEIERKGRVKDNFKAEVRSIESQYKSNELRFDYSWAFLKSIGILHLLSGDNTLTLLNSEDSDFKVLLRFLDNESPSRMSIKIGVLFVGKGQYNQKAIFFNTKGSEKYEQVIQQMGKPFKRHELHKSLSLQPNIIYYTDALYELVLHVITRMPTVPNDNQQLEKKKYVGNDSIHIVWNENDREYRPGTITGAFNFIHIIIHPLRNGLYQIRIRKKKDSKGKLVSFFGPILTGMVLPINLLPTLLRYTAFNARKAINYKMMRLSNPLDERKKVLEKIITKHAVRCEVKNGINQPFINKFISSSRID